VQSWSALLLPYDSGIFSIDAATNTKIGKMYLRTTKYYNIFAAAGGSIKYILRFFSLSD
jgi:hypothetical protein